MLKSSKLNSNPMTANFQPYFLFNETVNRLVIGSAWQTISAVTNRVLPTLLVIVLALLTKPAELGVFSFVIASYTTLSLVGDWGISYSLQRFIQENPKEVSRVASTGLLLRLAGSAALGMLCWLVDQSLGILKGYGLYVGLLLVSSSFGTVSYVFNATFKYKEANLVVIFRVICWFVLSIIFVALGQTILGPIYALTIAFLIIGIPTIFYQGISFYLDFDWHMAQRILRFGIFLTMASLFSVLTNQVGILSLAYLTNDHEVGIYKVASTFGILPMLLGEGVTLPLLPLIKKSMVQAADETPKLIRLIVRYLIIFGLFILGVGIVLADPLLTTIFGTKYHEAVWPLEFLLVANFLGLLFTVLTSIFFISDNLRDVTKITGIVAGLSLGGSLALTPVTRTSGPAISLCLANAIGLTLIIMRLYRWLPIRMEWRKYGIYALSFSEMMLILFIFVTVMPTLSLRLIGGMILAPPIYVTALLLQKGIVLSDLSRMVQIVKTKRQP